MRFLRLSVAFLAMAILSVSPVLAKPKATQASVVAAKKAAIIDYFTDLPKQGKTVGGVQVNEFEIYLTCNSYDRVVEMSGERPAMMGTELMFAMAYPPYESYLTRGIEQHMAAGGVVTMAWHWRNPLEVCVRGEIYECSKTPMSDEDLAKMLTPGTRENALMNADLDSIAGTFKRMAKRGIVILWRPLHEMNGDWFWWGQKKRYPELWDAMFDRLVNHNGVKNLIWVWGPDKASKGDVAAYFPKRFKPDFIGADVYADRQDHPEFLAAQTAYTKLTNAPFAFAEVGIPPSEAIVADTKPAWILLWGGDFLNGDWSHDKPCKNCNRPEDVAAFFKRPNIVNLEDLPKGFKTKMRAGIDAKPRKTPHCPSSLR